MRITFRIFDVACHVSSLECNVSMGWYRLNLSYATSRDSRPLLKGETLKKWLGDKFENGSGGVFQKSLKKGILSQTILKKWVHFQTVFETIPHPGARVRVDRGQGPGPRPQPGGVFFQTQFEKGTLFSK